MASEEFKKWLMQFYSTGEINPIKLGFSRNEIQSIFGEPDTVGGFSRKNKLPAILKYGEIEFHFGNKPEDKLYLIYQDNDDGIVEVCIKKKA